MNHRTFGAQLVPDRKRIFGPARIGVIEIVDPVGDRRMFGHDADGIGHRQIPSAGLFKFECDWQDFGPGYSSVTSIAISGTIGLGEPGLVFQAGGDGAVADFVGVAEFVEFEQFRRQRLAARVALTFVLVDADLQLSGHGERSPQAARACGASHFLMLIGQRRPLAGALLSYSVLHYRCGCAVKRKVIDHYIKCRPARTQTAQHLPPWGSPRCPGSGCAQEAELGGPEAINISALAKKLGVSQPAPYKHFADRETLLMAVDGGSLPPVQRHAARHDRRNRPNVRSCRALRKPRWISACAATASTA